MEILLWIGIAVGVFLGIIVLLMLVFTLAGLFMRKGHVVGRSLALNQTPEAVWQVISDFPNMPAWYGLVVKVERLEDREGMEVWRETYTGNYPIVLKTTEAVPPRRLARTIADEKGPFRGRWEFDIVPQETGSRLTITEFGEVPNPFFRFMARMFMDPALYLEKYLKALAGKFNEPANLEKAGPAVPVGPPPSVSTEAKTGE